MVIIEYKMVFKKILCQVDFILISTTFTTATDHIVSANKGWNPSINYTLWANNHTFYVGDLICMPLSLPLFTLLYKNINGLYCLYIFSFLICHLNYMLESLKSYLSRMRLSLRLPIGIVKGYNSQMFSREGSPALHFM